MAQRRQAQGSLEKIKLPLFGAFSNRCECPDKDQRFLNCYPESRKVDQTDITKTWIIKRPGLEAYKSFSSDTPRGIHFFNGKIYAAYGSDVYVDTFNSVGAPTALGLTITTTNTTIAMITGNSASTGDYLFICDGVDGWVVNTAGTVTPIIDADFPSPHIASPVFLDGYIVLAKGSDLFNCVVDDPTSWDATNFVSPESFPDPITALARQNNQIIAFGEYSSEFFYNAANASGSPFNRNEGALLQIGCASVDSVCQHERNCAFVGKSDSGGYAYWLIDGFQPRKVSDEYLDKILDHEDDITAIKGYNLRISGHMFYLLNLPTTDRTFVYDPDEKLWHEWSMNGGRFCINYATDVGNGHMYGQVDTSILTMPRIEIVPGDLLTNWVVSIEHNTGVDAVSDVLIYDIRVLFRTNRIDMDTINRKILHKLSLFMDQVDTGSTPVKLYMHDNDYRDFVPIVGTSSIDLYSDQDLPPYATRLGQFRRRSFEFEDVNTNAQTRYEAMELHYTEGIS